MRFKSKICEKLFLNFLIEREFITFNFLFIRHFSFSAIFSNFVLSLLISSTSLIQFKTSLIFKMF